MSPPSRADSVLFLQDRLRGERAVGGAGASASSLRGGLPTGLPALKLASLSSSSPQRQHQRRGSDLMDIPSARAAGLGLAPSSYHRRKEQQQQQQQQQHMHSSHFDDPNSRIVSHHNHSSSNRPPRKFSDHNLPSNF